MEDNKTFANFSAQGSLFTLKKSFVLDNHWVLQKVLNGSIPWETIDELVYYVDCDANAFRCIINFFKHPTDQSIINKLDPIDISLLQRAMKYLEINNEEVENEIKKVLRIKDNEKDEYKIKENEMLIKINNYKIKEMEQELQIIKLKDEITKLKENTCCITEDVLEDLVYQFNHKYISETNEDSKEDLIVEDDKFSNFPKGSIFDSAYSANFPDVL